MPDKTYLSKNFYKEEFECKCGCGFDSINPRLIQRLQALRDYLNATKPHNADEIGIHILSGCRCEAHNKAEHGEEDSAHLTGMAADIVANNSQFRFKVLAYCFRKFQRIGIYTKEGFIHLDIDGSKPQEVCW